MSLKASRTPLKIDDIFRILDGVDDDLDVLVWGQCHILQLCLFTNKAAMIILAFPVAIASGLAIPMTFIVFTTRSPSKIDDIAAAVDGVYDDYGHSWLVLVSSLTF